MRSSLDGPRVKSTNEMDTMADTCCAGSNWVLLELTGAECTVVNYRGDDKNAMRNVPVATCCTVVREPATGVDYLIIGYKMLWFGDQLSKSLLNQNQIRYAGHTVRDDPTRIQEEGFGITLIDGDIHIPFAMKGTSVYFESRTPTAHEIEALPVQTLTRDQPWDPATVDMRAAIKCKAKLVVRYTHH